jgi:hypothetical protein
MTAFLPTTIATSPTSLLVRLYDIAAARFALAWETDSPMAGLYESVAIRIAREVQEREELLAEAAAATYDLADYR